MARCEVCGNDYDKAFEVIAAGHSHIFDSFFYPAPPSEAELMGMCRAKLPAGWSRI